jgi:HSP20 family protein
METKSTATTRRPALATRQSGDFTDHLIEPFTQLRTEVDRLFENFPFRLPSMKLKRFVAAPALEMTETGKAYKITAELPGIDPDNVDVTFEDGLLRIAGEKKEEREENERGYRLSERSYGAFERLVELPSTANPEKIDAKFRNGILTITVAKDGEEKRNVRKISIGKQS